MIRNKLVMLSPHHADKDYRVRRTIEVIAELFDEVIVYWDCNYSGNQKQKNFVSPAVTEIYIENKSKEFVRLLFSRPILDNQVIESIKNAEFVYVHASAIEGLLYCRMLKQINPSCFIIFDYHDSLTYELFYQLKKIGLPVIYKPIWGLYQYYMKYLMRSVDALVGISQTQISDFQMLLGRHLETAVVPNFRAFSEIFDAPRETSDIDELSLIWLGSVMKGRDLSLLANWLSEIDTPPHLHVFGNIINQSVVDDLKAQLGTKVTFYDEFKNENDILPKLSKKVIGVFLGWDDPQATNINAHASPNKYFTYVNMEIPIIINGSLSELSEHVENTNAGQVVLNKAMFGQACSEISNNYSDYAKGVRKLKQMYRISNPKNDIKKFLETIKPMRKNDE